MYEQYYGFKEEPFRLSPDSRLCFLHPGFTKAKAYMQYALQRKEGFVMVTGRPGTGKSTLIASMTNDLAEQENVVFASLTCTQIEADDLLRLVVMRFGLDGSQAHKAGMLNDLETLLKRLHSAGKRPLLIIDEAQDLSANALEELRLLTNLQLNNQPLLQIFLVGQEELRDTVMSPGLEQLHQRLVAACHMRPLDENATRDYILHRLQHVGWDGKPELDESIFNPIHQASRGIPRLINMVCSRLFLHGMVEDREELTLDDVRDVIASLEEELLIRPAEPDTNADTGNRAEQVYAGVH
ncbi:MAG: general secretion pathway protein [Gammaproteobacteria bacterium]|nr:MAG: general secretion pathway protein [Gammaproteobacteria bacterium]